MSDIVSQDIDWILKQDLPWHQLENKTVLVTGANGFLPGYMVEVLSALNKRGMTVRVLALVRNMQKGRAKLGHLTGSGVEIIHQDISLPFSAELPDADFVIHAASQASPKYYGADPVGTLKANTLGTASLLDYSANRSVKGFLFFSSGEVYGSPDSADKTTSETDYGYLDPVNVRSCYAESKRMGETMCVSWAHQFGIPVKIVRPFHTYGPGMMLDDGRVFADFVAAVVEKRAIVLNSDGSAIRPFCYLADATAGFFTVLLKGETGNAYNVGNPFAETTIKDLAYLLSEILPDRKVDVIINGTPQKEGYIKSAVQRLLPDISKIGALGWKPQTDLIEGFRRTIVSYI